MIALLNVISQENHGFQYTVYDLQDDEIETAARQQRDPEILPAELQSIFDPDRSGNENRVVAFRRNRRWLQVYDRVALDETPPGQLPVRLREQGVYVITGGLGKVGLALAEYLALEANARLVLISRTPIPARAEWQHCLSQHDASDKLPRIINQLQRLEASAAEVSIENADISDLAGMQKLVDDVIARYGRIDGVIHAAGVVSGSSLEVMHSLTRADCELQFVPKIHGLIVLHQLFNDYPLDFVMPVSSLSTVLGGLGFAAYSAANQFMDSFCQQQHNQGNKHWISVNWDGWFFDETDNEEPPSSGTDSRAPDSFSMSASEGQQVFSEILNSPLMPQVVVSTGDLDTRLRQWIYSAPDDTEDEVASRSSYERPEMTTPYMEPTTEVEKSICELWQELLGVKRVGIDDDFFELGGHSLLATQLIGRLRTELALGLSLDIIFGAPTVRQLAAFVGSQQTATEPPDELDQMARQIKQMTPEQREQMLAQARKEKAQ
jgi:NAD(P)-dependent dehydrogenase (short-subunit alcohol dehydrogenase family)/acyl carrier protein